MTYTVLIAAVTIESVCVNSKEEVAFIYISFYKLKVICLIKLFQSLIFAKQNFFTSFLTNV